MNLLKIFLSLLLCTGFLFIQSCDDDEPTIPNEGEVITTLNYYLTPTGGGDVVIFSFRDLDGEGGNAPVITSDPLSANTSYSGRLELLNESETPADNITEEVEAEKEDHQFFYNYNADNLSISYQDSDSNGNPVGITTQLTTGVASNSTLTIILRHQPDKSASGVAAGDITNAGGDTDIEVTFDVVVQ